MKTPTEHKQPPMEWQGNVLIEREEDGSFYIENYDRGPYAFMELMPWDLEEIMSPPKLRIVINNDKED